MSAMPLILAVALCLASVARAQPAKRVSIKDRTSERVQSLLGSIEKESDFARVSRSLDSLLDELVAHAPTSETDAFRETIFARRLVDQLSSVKNSRLELYTFLRANPALAETLVFLVRPADKVETVYSLLNTLRERHGKDLNRLASLTAAICVVHDRPLKSNVNENSVSPTDPLQVFEYFKKHERRMFFPPAEMPAELLISVVNITASIQELEWALARYRSDGRVGQRYFDVRYDTHHFRTGEDKKLTLEGFNLPNILKYGGVCADQAYFAQQVGKAQGIPTASISGANASMSHAWVGFFEVVAGKPRWNFDSGQYDDYENVRGNTTDPQTGAGIPDSWLALNLDASIAGARPRRTAIAFIDAAERLYTHRNKSRGFPPTGETILPVRTPARAPTLEGKLELLEAGLRLCPTLSHGWKELTDSAKDLSMDQKRYWSEALFKLCGDNHPDFTLSVLTPLVATVKDTEIQDSMWNDVFKTYKQRPDLAAQVRFNQAKMWERAKQPGRAWDAYQEVMLRFPNDTPLAVVAAMECERVLRANNKDGSVCQMYGDFWKKTTRPSASVADGFRAQSNWHRVGSLYHAALLKAGNTVKASQVERDLER